MNLFSEITGLFNEGLEAVRPGVIINGTVSLESGTLLINYPDGVFSTDLSQYDNVIVIGAGKASAAMAAGLEKVLGDRISFGAVVTKYGFGEKLSRIKLLQAGHPVPDKAGVKASEKILEICSRAGANDLIISLLSGGASSLLPLPVKGISLDDKIEFTRQMLSSGASIEEINQIRKHLSDIKGGGLLKYSAPARLVSLILSDVVGDRLDVIASGITVPVERSYEKCLLIVDKYKLRESLPGAVLKHLQTGAGAKPGHDTGAGYLPHPENIIIGNNGLALEKIREKAAGLGYITKIMDRALTGEARIVGRRIAREAVSFAKDQALPGKKYCFLYGGETTVTLKGKGRGGRNQELALAAAIELKDTGGITILSGGTDGNDGPTDAAGAVCDGETYRQGTKLGMEAQEYLERNDSYHFFKAIKRLLVTGPTGTNVMDVQIVLLSGD